MRKLIEDFPDQMAEALEIGRNHGFKKSDKQFTNVVICGLGGSGIGGSFVNDALKNEINLPITIVKNYFLPKFVNEQTLLIISSYSGNTEESVACFKEGLKRNAHICAVSSNGLVEQISIENKIDFIKIPGGMPPRACFALSTVQLFYILNNFNLINDNFTQDFEKSIVLLNKELESIKTEAKTLADQVYNKIPVLYAAGDIESIAVRWRQQINENGKQLCWHHVVPEMNHNELVGWRQKNDDLAVIFLRNTSDFYQIQKRMDLNKEVYKEYTPHIFEVWSKGESFIEKAIYLLNLGDWLSLFLSDLRGFNTTEVKVIDELKANLK